MSILPQLQTAIIAHGSWLQQPMIERIAKLVLFVCPENDAYMDAEFRGDIEKVRLKHECFSFRL